jgi:hypothetical protein
MQHSAELLRCLRECDVEGMRALWQHVSPHLPQPESDEEALISIHMARTQTDPLPLKLRAYSHAWLTERGLPSQLPDHLKPKAQRIYPVIVTAVGTAVSGARFGTPVTGAHADLNEELRAVMRNTVLECYADKKTEGIFVRDRLRKAIKKVYRNW